MDANEKGVKLGNVSKIFAIYHIGHRDNITNEDPKIVLLDKQGEIIKIPY